MCVWLPSWLSSEEFAGNTGDAGSIPGSKRPPEEGSGNSLQYSRLRNPVDRGAWRAAVHGVHKELYMTLWLDSNKCCTSPWFIYFITIRFYLFTHFTYLPHHPLPLAISSLFSVSVRAFALFLDSTYKWDCTVFSFSDLFHLA